MPQPIRASLAFMPERFRSESGRRAAGLVLALLLEALLALLLLTLAPSPPPARVDERVAVFSFAPEAQQPEAAPEPAKASAEPTGQDPQPAEPSPVQPSEPTTPAQPQPAVAAPSPAPPIIPLPREQMAQADIAPQPPRAAAPAAPARRTYGPPDTGGARTGWADTPRVDGTGPHGEPLYAAAWYREPYPEELRGYLSSARGPGWGLIACRTAPNWRVEDCVAVGESPDGSNIARAVLAAAWQFKVRPPRIGGETRVGEWVRIRIDYNMRER